LVWFESHESRAAAVRRERQIKEWRRAWKLWLIEERNQRWEDLSLDIAKWIVEEERRRWGDPSRPGSRLSPG
jgi:putative endonuclease